MSTKQVIGSLLGLLLVATASAAEGTQAKSEMQRLWGEVGELEARIEKPKTRDAGSMAAYRGAVADAYAQVARKNPESPVGLMIASSAGNSYSMLVQSGHQEFAEPGKELLEPFLAEPPEGTTARDLEGLVAALALLHGGTDDWAAMDRVLERGKELGVEPSGFRASSLAKYLRARPGAPAPALTGKAADGLDFTLADWNGRPVLVHFWSTLETEVVERLAPLQEAHRRYGTRGLSFVGVNTDENPARIQRPPPDTVKRVSVAKWASEYGLPWPQLVHEHDAEIGRFSRGEHNPFAKAWGVWETTAVFLVGPDGKVLLRRPATSEALFAAIERLVQPE